MKSIEAFIMLFDGRNGLDLTIALILCFATGYALKWLFRRRFKSNTKPYQTELERRIGKYEEK